MENLEQMPKEKREETEEIREKFGEILEQERKYSNPGSWPFHFIEAFQRFKTRLNLEDIMTAEANRINELNEKAKSGSLTDKERKELKLRENSEMFMDLIAAKDVQPAFPKRKSFEDVFAMPAGAIYKETYHPIYQIVGVVDGKEVVLRKHVWPADTEQFSREFNKPFEPAFYMGNWKGPVVEIYDGWVDGKEISEEEAVKLFSEYESFATQRSHEIQDLRKTKEKESYGQEVGHNLRTWEESRVVPDKKKRVWR